MADLAIGIKITADGNSANAALTHIEGTIAKFAQTAKRAARASSTGLLY